MSKCKGCGAEIKWVLTKNGKLMPLDAKLKKFYVISAADVPIQMQGYEIHWATCPKAQDFKKSKP